MGIYIKGGHGCGMSYIIANYKYIKTGQLAKRVNKTVEMYGIHTSYHLDVLTSEVRRYNFEKGYEAAADINLEAKKAIIQEFNKYDIDITSETLAHPFVGRLGLPSQHVTTKTIYFSQEKNLFH